MKVKFKSVYFFILIFVFALFFSYSKFIVLAKDNRQDTDLLNYEFSDNSLLLLSDNSDINCDNIRNLFKDDGVLNVKNLTPNLNTNIFKIQFSFNSKEKILKLINKHTYSEGVLKIEPNYSGTFGETANDEYFNQQWGLNDINIKGAWDITTGSHSVRVGVIDTGVATHIDLVDNLAEGWNFFDNNDDTKDKNGHGTHVSGIIGAVGDNNIGISGINKKVKIVPLKIAHYSSWEISYVIEAINYVQSLHGTENEIDILNFSGWNFPIDLSLFTAIENYSGLFVCISGNGSKDIDTYPNYPGSFNCANLMTVGSIDINGDKSSFSNYGKTSVDLFAPGGNIYSTLPNNAYGNLSGTSMAAPHVTGVAALIYAKYPYLPASEVKAAIVNNVRKLDNLKEDCISGGILDAYTALTNAHTIHTASYQYRNANQHYVICKYCSKTIRSEAHTLIRYFGSKPGKICNGCGYILYNDGTALIPYKQPDQIM